MADETFTEPLPGTDETTPAKTQPLITSNLWDPFPLTYDTPVIAAPGEPTGSQWHVEVWRTDCTCCGNCPPSSWGRRAYQYREHPTIPGRIDNQRPVEAVAIRGGTPTLHVYNATGYFSNLQDTYWRVNDLSPLFSSTSGANSFCDQGYQTMPGDAVAQGQVTGNIYGPGGGLSNCSSSFFLSFWRPGTYEHNGFDFNAPCKKLCEPAGVGCQAMYNVPGSLVNSVTGGAGSVPPLGLDYRKPIRMSGPIWCWGNNPIDRANVVYNGGLVFGQKRELTSSNTSFDEVPFTIYGGRQRGVHTAWDVPAHNAVIPAYANQEILALSPGANPWQTTKITSPLLGDGAGTMYIDIKSGPSPADAFLTFFRTAARDRTGVAATASGIPDYVAANSSNECVLAGTYPLTVMGFANGVKRSGTLEYNDDRQCVTPTGGWMANPLIQNIGLLNVIGPYQAGGFLGRGDCSGGVLPVKFAVPFSQCPCKANQSGLGQGCWWVKAVPLADGIYSLRMYVYDMAPGGFILPGQPLDPSQVFEFLAVSAPVTWTPAMGLPIEFTGWTFENETPPPNPFDTDAFGNPTVIRNYFSNYDRLRVGGFGSIPVWNKITLNYNDV